MIAVLVEFRIAPGRAEAFAERVAQQAEDSLAQEPGCRRFDVWRSSEGPDGFVLYEIYIDRDAFFETHLKSAHFLAFDAEVGPWVLEKSVRVLDQMVS